MSVRGGELIAALEWANRLRRKQQGQTFDCSKISRDVGSQGKGFMEPACSGCSAVFTEGAKFCSNCGRPRGAAAVESAPAALPINTHKFRKFLGSIPGLTLTQDLLEGLSGVSEVLEQVQREPQNAFAHYRLAMSMDGLQKSRKAYRAIRLVVHPAGAAIGMALGKTLQALDRENIDPKQSALLCCTMAATKSLKEKGFDARQCLVLGVASYQLANLMPSTSALWRGRAKKAFSLVMARADNAFVAADAALGLQQILETEKKPSLALEYRQFAQAVGSRSSLLGFTPGSGPSIWDVTAKPIEVEQRIRNTISHVASRQTARTRNLLARGAEALDNWTKET